MPDLLGELDLVCVFDTTGSMRDYLEHARRQALTGAKKVAASGDLSIRYAVVEYRDHPPQDTMLTRVHPFGGEAKFQKVLDGLEAKGGGDAAEAVWDGLVAAGNLDWRPHADRLVFLFGDAPPHGYEVRNYSRFGIDHWPDGCPCGLALPGIAELYGFNHIRLYAVCLGRRAETAKAFTEVAEACGGHCTIVGQVADMSKAWETKLADHGDLVKAARTYVATVKALGFEASIENIAQHMNSTIGLHVNSATVEGLRTYLSARGLSDTGEISPTNLDTTTGKLSGKEPETPIA